MSAPSTAGIRDFWQHDPCGTAWAAHPQFTRPYYEEIEAHRYRLEPFIHAFAQFTRYHGKRVLEVGVGAGTDHIQFARAGAVLSGIDLTDAGIEHARRRLALEGLSSELREGNAEAMPYDDASFDLAYAWGVIHHAHDTGAVLREMIRVTKPGGEVKVMVYNLAATHTWLKWLHRGLPRGQSRAWVLARYQESPGTKGYTPATFGTLLAGQPVTDVRFDWYDETEPAEGAGRAERLIRTLARVQPRRMGWFLCCTMRKARPRHVTA